MSELDYPRKFRLIYELENSSKVPGVSYGLVDPADKNLRYWSGSLITNTGHFIELSFECKDDYPTTAPIISFNPEYKGKKKGDYEDEMGTFVERVNRLCDKDSSNLRNDVLVWNKGKSIATYLGELYKKIC